MKGCGGCLGPLAILVLLGWASWSPNLFLIAIALVVVSAAGRGLVHPRPRRDASSGGSQNASPREMATRRREQRQVRGVPTAVRTGPSTQQGTRRARDPLPAQLRFSILQRDRFRCHYCGRPGSAPGVVLHVDHVVPVAAGGPTSKENLLTACEECNLGKGTRSMAT